MINTIRDLDDALCIFNNLSSMKSDIVRAGEKIALALYKALRTVTSLNQFTYAYRVFQQIRNLVSIPINEIPTPILVLCLIIIFRKIKNTLNNKTFQFDLSFLIKSFYFSATTYLLKL